MTSHSRRNTRYPHCFSPGKPVGPVSEGSRRGLAKKPIFVPKPLRERFMAPKLEFTLSSLVVEQQELLIRCTSCDRRRTFSPLEAVVSYGGLVTFEELAALIRSRCRSDACPVTVAKSGRYDPFKTRG